MSDDIDLAPYLVDAPHRPLPPTPSMLDREIAGCRRVVIGCGGLLVLVWGAALAVFLAVTMLAS